MRRLDKIKITVSLSDHSNLSRPEVDTQGCNANATVMDSSSAGDLGNASCIWFNDHRNNRAKLVEDFSGVDSDGLTSIAEPSENFFDTEFPTSSSSSSEKDISNAVIQNLHLNPFNLPQTKLPGKNIIFSGYAQLLRFVKRTREWQGRPTGLVTFVQNSIDRKKICMVMVSEDSPHSRLLEQSIWQQYNFCSDPVCQFTIRWDFKTKHNFQRTYGLRFINAERCEKFLKVVKKIRHRSNPNKFKLIRRSSCVQEYRDYVDDTSVNCNPTSRRSFHSMFKDLAKEMRSEIRPEFDISQADTKFSKVRTVTRLKGGYAGSALSVNCKPESCEFLLPPGTELQPKNPSNPFRALPVPFKPNAKRKNASKVENKPSVPRPRGSINVGTQRNVCISKFRKRIPLRPNAANVDVLRSFRQLFYSLKEKLKLKGSPFSLSDMELRKLGQELFGLTNDISSNNMPNKLNFHFVRPKYLYVGFINVGDETNANKSNNAPNSFMEKLRLLARQKLFKPRIRCGNFKKSIDFRKGLLARKNLRYVLKEKKLDISPITKIYLKQSKLGQITEHDYKNSNEFIDVVREIFQNKAETSETQRNERDFIILETNENIKMCCADVLKDQTNFKEQDSDCTGPGRSTNGSSLIDRNGIKPILRPAKLIFTNNARRPTKEWVPCEFNISAKGTQVFEYVLGIKCEFFVNAVNELLKGFQIVCQRALVTEVTSHVDKGQINKINSPNNERRSVKCGKSLAIGYHLVCENLKDLAFEISNQIDMNDMNETVLNIENLLSERTRKLDTRNNQSELNWALKTTTNGNVKHEENEKLDSKNFNKTAIDIINSENNMNEMNNNEKPMILSEMIVKCSNECPQKEQVNKELREAGPINENFTNSLLSKKTIEKPVEKNLKNIKPLKKLTNEETIIEKPLDDQSKNGKFLREVFVKGKPANGQFTNEAIPKKQGNEQYLQEQISFEKESEIYMNENFTNGINFPNENLLNENLVVETLVTENFLNETLVTENLLNESLSTVTILCESENVLNECLLNENVLNMSLPSENILNECLPAVNVTIECLANENIMNESLVTENVMNEGLVTGNDMNESLVTENDMNESLVTGNDMNESLVTEDVVNESFVIENVMNESLMTENDMKGTLVTENVMNESLITENDMNENLMIENVLNECMVTENLLDKNLANENVTNEHLANENELNEGQNLTNESPTNDLELNDSFMTGNVLNESFVNENVANDNVKDDKDKIENSTNNFSKEEVKLEESFKESITANCVNVRVSREDIPKEIIATRTNSNENIKSTRIEETPLSIELLNESRVNSIKANQMNLCTDSIKANQINVHPEPYFDAVKKEWTSGVSSEKICTKIIESEIFRLTTKQSNGLPEDTNEESDSEFNEKVKSDCDNCESSQEIGGKVELSMENDGDDRPDENEDLNELTEDKENLDVTMTCSMQSNEKILCENVWKEDSDQKLTHDENNSTDLPKMDHSLRSIENELADQSDRKDENNILANANQPHEEFIDQQNLTDLPTKDSGFYDSFNNGEVEEASKVEVSHQCGVIQSRRNSFLATIMEEEIDDGKISAPQAVNTDCDEAREQYFEKLQGSKRCTDLNTSEVRSYSSEQSISNEGNLLSSESNDNTAVHGVQKQHKRLRFAAYQNIDNVAQLLRQDSLTEPFPKSIIKPCINSLPNNSSGTSISEEVSRNRRFKHSNWCFPDNVHEKIRPRPIASRTYVRIPAPKPDKTIIGKNLVTKATGCSFSVPLNETPRSTKRTTATSNRTMPMPRPNSTKLAQTSSSRKIAQTKTKDASTPPVLGRKILSSLKVEQPKVASPSKVSISKKSIVGARSLPVSVKNAKVNSFCSTVSKIPDLRLPKRATSLPVSPKRSTHAKPLSSLSSSTK